MSSLSKVMKPNPMQGETEKGGGGKEGENEVQVSKEP